MVPSLYSAAAGMLASELAESDVAGNIANLDTPGYREVQPVWSTFAPLFLSRLQGAGVAPLGAVASGAAVAATALDWNAGPLTATTNPLAAAIEGPGFFAVRTAAGVRYTRAGDFRWSAGGVLVDAAGDAVLDPAGRTLRLPPGRPDLAAEAVLLPDGRVVAGGAAVGTVGVFLPPLGSLSPAGGALYAAGPAGPGAAPLGPVPVRLRPGFLEGSNVDLVGQMALLLQLQQAYAADQQAVLTVGNAMSEAVSDVGAVP